MSAASIRQMSDRIAALMEQRLGVRGDGLAEKLARGGGKLPREVREAAEHLAESAEAAQNPALFLRLDHGRIARDYDLCLRHLKRARRWEHRGELAIALLGRLAVIVLAVSALVVGLAWWRGLI